MAHQGNKRLPLACHHADSFHREPSPMSDRRNPPCGSPAEENCGSEILRQVAVPRRHCCLRPIQSRDKPSGCWLVSTDVCPPSQLLRAESGPCRRLLGGATGASGHWSFAWPGPAFVFVTGIVWIGSQPPAVGSQSIQPVLH